MPETYADTRPYRGDPLNTLEAKLCQALTAGIGPGAISAVGFYGTKSIVETRAIATNAANRIVVYNGGLTGGDAGGSATYGWDNTSTTADDGFGVLQPTDQGGNPLLAGRWVQIPAT